MSVKWYIKMISVFPLLFSFFIIYMFSKSVEIYDFFIPGPFYLFYFVQIMFLYLCFVKFTYKLMFYSEYIVIVRGFEKYRINYSDMIEIDRKVIKWLRGEPEYLVIKYYDNKKKVKSIKIEKNTFGRNSNYMIAKYLAEKSIMLNKFVYKFS